MVSVGAAVDVFHLTERGTTVEVGKGRWIISSKWIIIYCGVHSTVLSSPARPQRCCASSQMRERICSRCNEALGKLLLLRSPS